MKDEGSKKPPILEALGHRSQLVVLIAQASFYLWLNCSTYSDPSPITPNVVAKAWGWPFRNWGNGVPGEFGDVGQVIQQFMNVFICLVIAIVFQVLWTVFLLEFYLPRVERASRQSSVSASPTVRDNSSTADDTTEREKN